MDIAADELRYDQAGRTEYSKARMMEAFDGQVEKYGRTREAVENTLRLCRNQNVLKDYLAEEEAATIMFTLLDEQKARRFWEEEIREEGIQKGRREGENKLSMLIKNLRSAGRNNDIDLALSDSNYREKLYREMNIV